MEKYTTPIQIETYVKNGKNSFIFRVEKIGTKKVLFFATNEKKQRLTSTLFASKSSAVSVARQFLNKA